MPRDPIPTWCFALIVVRQEDRFLMVHERKHGQQWYLPAGRVEPGESFVVGALRETLEETGVPVQLTGILRFEHTPSRLGARLRIIFLAEPVDDTPPKSVPDEESLGAAWVRLDQLNDYPLRDPEVAKLFAYVAEGGPVYPMSLLHSEGKPF